MRQPGTKPEIMPEMSAVYSFFPVTAIVTKRKETVKNIAS